MISYPNPKPKPSTNVYFPACNISWSMLLQSSRALTIACVNAQRYPPRHSTGRKSRVCSLPDSVLRANANDSFYRYVASTVLWPLEACDRTFRNLELKWRFNNSGGGLLRHMQARQVIIKPLLHFGCQIMPLTGQRYNKTAWNKSSA
jgi:hypothetical protein